MIDIHCGYDITLTKNKVRVILFKKNVELDYCLRIWQTYKGYKDIEIKCVNNYEKDDVNLEAVYNALIGGFKHED